MSGRQVGAYVPIELYEETRRIIDEQTANGIRRVTLSDAVINGLALYNQVMNGGDGKTVFFNNPQGAPPTPAMKGRKP